MTAARDSVCASSPKGRVLPRWTWGSTTPGSTALPRASKVALVPPRSSPRATIRPSAMPTSARSDPVPGTTSVPPPTTRSSITAPRFARRLRRRNPWGGWEGAATSAPSDYLAQELVGEERIDGDTGLEVQVLHHEVPGVLHLLACHPPQALLPGEVGDDQVPEDRDLLQRQILVELRVGRLHDGDRFRRVGESELDALERRLHEALSDVALLLEVVLHREDPLGVEVHSPVPVHKRADVVTLPGRLLEHGQREVVGHHRVGRVVEDDAVLRVEVDRQPADLRLVDPVRLGGRVEDRRGLG